MTVEYRVISIGTLSKNFFWGEKDQVRTPHATTTLIVSGDKKILVDPALPGQVLNARLFERAGIRNSEITMVFLTTYRSAHRGALAAFDKAKWFIHEREKEYARAYLEEMYRKNKCEGHDPPQVDRELIAN
ncbi:MAG: MBL fold metallo-hydrolase, partial [Phycisphaerae bacterium]